MLVLGRALKQHDGSPRLQYQYLNPHLPDRSSSCHGEHERARSFEDRFELGRLLGTGSFGEVWECRDRQSWEVFACKVVQKQERHRERYLGREIEVMRALKGRHKGVVRVEDVIDNGREFQVVMEVCRGGDLYDLLHRRGPLPEHSAKAVFKQLAESLDFCHSQGIIHRDIKPENILFDYPATCLYAPASFPSTRPPVQAKFGDFGLSTMVQPGERTGGTVGSPCFMAPEVVVGSLYGRRADVWSLGVVLCVMLTHRLPFTGSSPEDTAGLKQAILEAQVDFTLPCWRGVSGEAKDLVLKMLQPDPAWRIQAHELMCHPWCSGEDTQGRDPSSVDLSSSVSNPGYTTRPMLALPAPRRSRSLSDDSMVRKSALRATGLLPRAQEPHYPTVAGDLFENQQRHKYFKGNPFVHMKKKPVLLLKRPGLKFFRGSGTLQPMLEGLA